VNRRYRCPPFLLAFATATVNDYHTDSPLPTPPSTVRLQTRTSAPSLRLSPAQGTRAGDEPLPPLPAAANPVDSCAVSAGQGTAGLPHMSFMLTPLIFSCSIAVRFMLTMSYCVTLLGNATIEMLLIRPEMPTISQAHVSCERNLKHFERKGKCKFEVVERAKDLIGFQTFDYACHFLVGAHRFYYATELDKQ
ncbi:hypothetical protein E2562_027456, partial [Oryza meyeriana var. granulata]